jgi:hypothetical protein
MLDIRPLTEFFEAEMTEGFLELLLNMMRLTFQFDEKFRRNIDGFQGRYLFRRQDGQVTVSTEFANGDMHLGKDPIPAPNLTLTFRDDKALMGLLLAPKPDILGAMLRQDVTLEGNLNYLYKFAYMAKRLQLMATGQA